MVIERDIAISPVIGWRQWNMAWWNDGSAMVPRLLSFGSTVWPANEWLRADCKQEGQSHPAPQVFCQCGIHARKNRHEVDSPPSLFGEVELAGLVVEAEQGYMASHGYPKKLYLPANSSCTQTEPGPVSESQRLAVLRHIIAESVCICIGQPHVEFARLIADSYGVELELTETVKCRCDVHCKKETEDEHREASKVHRDTGSSPWQTSDFAQKGTGQSPTKGRSFLSALNPWS